MFVAAERIAAMAPGDLNKVLFCNAGESRVFAPPFIVKCEQIDTMVNVLADAIRRHT